MTMHRLITSAVLSIILFTSLSPKNRFDRYNPYSEDTPVAETTRTAPADEESNMPPEDAGIDPCNVDDAALGDEDESESHGPLGAICAELAQYCSYFANNMMVTEEQRAQQSSLLVFCNVMELMADLADSEVSSIRAETYAADLIKIILSLRDAFTQDSAFTDNAARFPLLAKIVNLGEDSVNTPDGYTTELGIYIHNTLRSPDTAPTLVNELFEELNQYAQVKSHILFDMFHADSRHLLILSNQPLRLPNHKQAQYQNAEGRHMRQMSWICHHAANACTDLAATLQTTENLTYAAPLMRQLNSLLSAMSMTYSHLSAPAGTVRRQDSHVMAQHFASMIELLPRVSPKRAPHSSLEYTYLDRCTRLSTHEEKQHFVEEAFARDMDRDALLEEFFPAFEKAVDHNLNGFSSSLASFTTSTLAQRFWPEKTTSE